MIYAGIAINAPPIPNKAPPIRTTRSVVIGCISTDFPVSYGFTIFASIVCTIVISTTIKITSLNDFVKA